MTESTAATDPSPAQRIPSISLRPPSHSPEASSSTSEHPIYTFVPPTTFFQGTWHVTHSSLPMWKKAQNVSINYTVLSTDASGRPTFDNLVEYQSLGSAPDASKKTVKGVEAPREATEGSWRWRGKGWLMIASSNWEVLGFGRSSVVDEDGGGSLGREMECAPATREDDWVVTYFAKTLFTPSGIDVYCRRRQGLDDAVIGRIKDALKSCGEEVEKLGEVLLEVRRTGV